MERLCVILLTCSSVWAFPQFQTHTSSEDLKMEARIDDEVDDYGAPGFFSFHNGEPFTVEKDPVTGNLDFNKKETPDYGFYKEDIDRKDAKPKPPAYHTPNDIPSNPFKISAVDSSLDLHQFLNLPVHYSTSGKFPLISSSYANMKVQGSASSSSSSSVSNHRHYTPSSTTSTAQPPSYYTSATVKTTAESLQPTRTTPRPTVTTTQPSTTKPPSYRSTTTVSPPTTTTKLTITSTTTTTPVPSTRTTTTERVINKVPPQQVWNISEPVDYNPEEEVSYVDYEYEPEMVNHHVSGYHEQNQVPVHGSDTKDTANFNQKVGEPVKNQEINEVLPYNKQSTTTTAVPQTSTKITTTTSKVSIVTSLPISSSTFAPTTSAPTTSKTKDQYSTSMPVTAPDVVVRPGVGNTYLFSGQLGENAFQNNVNNFFRPSSNEDSFKPMPSINESFPYFNERPESSNSQEIVYEQKRPTTRPEVSTEEIHQNQKPYTARPTIEPHRQDPPFPFENNQQQQQVYYQKPNKPVLIEQTRPEITQFEQNKPHTGQKYQPNLKPERPQKYPGSEPDHPFQFESNQYQVQNQYNKQERPNKYNQGIESVQHQHFDQHIKNPQQFNKHPISQDLHQQQVQFTAHLSTGPIPSGPVSQVKRPQNPNIHPSDLRPPPPPSFSENSEEEVNFVKKPILPPKPVKTSSNTKPPPISTSGGFVNIQPGKIQSMVPIRVPTEMDQNSQSYSLQTSFSIGTSGDDNARYPVAQGSVIDENINNINRSDLVPPPIPQRPQTIRPPPPSSELPQRPHRPVQAQHTQNWESYTPHHYPNNKVKTDAEVLKPSLPNILPQFRPNAKTGHVDPNTQYIDTRVKQPLEHLQPPPLPRPQYLRIDRNDEDIKEPMMHSAKQSMRVFQKPTANKVTTLQMMQQGQSPPNVPLKRIIRTENKPHHKMPKPNLEMKPQQVLSDKMDGNNPVHVVYPTTNQRLTPEYEDVVVVGSHGSQRPSPPNNLQVIDENPFHLEDPVPFLLAERDRDTPVLKTKPIKPLKNDFPYSLVKDTDFLDMDLKETKIRKPMEETKISQEYTAFSPTESTNPKMDPDTELNVIPYLQDYSPYATRKPAHNRPISVTLKNILASSTLKPNLGMIERVEITPQIVKQKFNAGSQDITVGTVMDMNLANHKSGTSENKHNSESQSVSSIQPQDFQAPFQPSLSNPESQGWRVIGNTTREYPEEKQMENETTVRPSDFSFEQFKPQLFGGFKPIVASESDEEELELDA